MFKINLTEKFLLECVRADSEDELKNSVMPFLSQSGKIRWQEEIQNKFGLTLAAYLRVKEKYREFNIPEDTSELIEATYASNILSNKLIIHTAAELSAKFASVGIDAIFLKGSALLTTAYKHDIGLRSLTDIDILIKKEQLPQAEQILKEAGYKDLYTKEQRDEHLEEFCHLQYGKNGEMVELHWNLTHDIVLDRDVFLARALNEEIIKELFKRAQRVNANGSGFNILCPADELFSACCHFNKHWIFERYIERIIKLIELFFFNISYDLKQLCQYYGEDIDWDRFFILAESADNEFETFTMLYLAAKVFNFSIPQSTVNRMRKNGYTKLYIFLCKAIKHNNLSLLFFIRQCIFDFKQIAWGLKHPGSLLRNIAYFARAARLTLLDLIAGIV